MTNEDIRRRLNEVIRTDATVADEADFMMTHMPFKKLVDFNYDINMEHYLIREEDYENVPHFDENALYDSFVKDPDLHTFFMILGKNGSGKSHLIRWMYFKYVKEMEGSNEKTIFIERAHNSLREAIKKVLDAHIISEERTKFYLDKIGGGVADAEDDEIRDLLFENLKILVQYDKKMAEEDDANLPIRRDLHTKLLAIMSSDCIKENLFKCEDGPIDRLLARVTKQENRLAEEEAFQSSDFTFTPQELTTKFMTAPNKPSSNILMALNNLQTNTADRKEIARYLNRLEGKVIERTASITGADVRSIFEEIRKELKEEGKTLTLFIEDINVYKGVDSALIEVLIQEHNNSNGLCRVKSVVGSTDAFFDSYNASLRDRMTRKVVILEKTLLENNEKTIELAARYINAIYTKKDTAEEWYNGNIDFPIARNEYKFSNVPVDGKIMTIFPFTQHAIVNLYNSINVNARTPRNFLKSVIKNVLEKWINYGPDIINSKHYFLGTEAITSLVGWKDVKYEDWFSAQNYPDRDRREILYTIWGNGTNKIENGDLAGVPKEVLTLFNIETDVDTTNLETSYFNDAISTNDAPNTEPVPQTENPEYTEYLKKRKVLNEWASGTIQQFSMHKEFRGYVKDYIYANINWEMYDIPEELADDILKDRSSIFIEGQDVSSNAVINISRDQAAGRFLICLLDFNYYKGWTYDGGADKAVEAKAWLISNREKIVSSIRAAINCGLDLKTEIITDRVYRALAFKKVSKLTTGALLDVVARLTSCDDSKINETIAWKKLKSNCEKTVSISNELFGAYFLKTVGSSASNAEKVKYYIVDPIVLKEHIDLAVKKIAKGNSSAVPENANNRVKTLINSNRNCVEAIDQCMDELPAYVNDKVLYFNSIFGDDISEKVTYNTISKMQEYLIFVKKEMNLQYPPTLSENIDKLSQKYLVRVFKDLVNLRDSNDLKDKLANYSRLDISKLNATIDTINSFKSLMSQKNAIWEPKIDSTTDNAIQIEKAKIISIIARINE